MEPVIIVTVLALLQLTWFGIEVGSMRKKHGIKAPESLGHPEFDRRFRIHENTLGQLVAFLPALWLFAHMVNPLWAAGVGVVYLAGRFVYRSAYFRNPASRGPGFALTSVPVLVMLIWVLVDAIRALV